MLVLMLTTFYHLFQNKQYKHISRLPVSALNMENKCGCVHTTFIYTLTIVCEQSLLLVLTVTQSNIMTNQLQVWRTLTRSLFTLSKFAM